MRRCAWFGCAFSLASLAVGCEGTPTLQPSGPPSAPVATPQASSAPASSAPIADGLATGDALGIGAPRFVDSFSGSQVDASRWRVLTGNTGRVTQDNGELRITAERGTAFPFVSSIPAIIPANGPWAIEWGFKWKVFSDSVVFALDLFPPKGFDVPVYGQPFWVAGPQNDFLRGRYFHGGEGFSTGVVFDGRSHRLRFEGDGDKLVRAFFDGALVSSITSEIRPLRFWVGSFPVVNGGFRNWTDLSLDYVVAGSLTSSQTTRQDSGATKPAAVSASPEGQASGNAPI